MKLSSKLSALGLASVVAYAGGTLIAPHEGLVTRVYVDPVGILTSCYGHTGSELRQGQHFTHQQCLSQLADDLQVFDRQLLYQTKEIGLSDGEHAAYLSFIYNVGASAFRTSTLLKKIKKGDRRAACNELSRWVYAGGKKLPGLIKRREKERQVCLKELENVATNYQQRWQYSALHIGRANFCDSHFGLYAFAHSR